MVPFGLELKFLDGVEKTVEGTIARYNELSRTLFHLENYVIPCYNSEKPVMDLVEWDDAVEKYKLQARLSSSSSVEPASKKEALRAVAECLRPRCPLRHVVKPCVRLPLTSQRGGA